MDLLDPEARLRGRGAWREHCETRQRGISPAQKEILTPFLDFLQLAFLFKDVVQSWYAYT